MSWQEYVDDQIMADGHVKKAAIIGLDGEIWAKTENCDITTDEAELFASNYTNVSHFYANGIIMAKTKFFYLSGTDRVLRGKKSKNGFHSIRTESAIIIAIYEEPVTAQHVATIVETLGEYLISYGS